MFMRFFGVLSAALVAGACAVPVETFRAAAYSEIARVQMAAGDPAGARDTAQRAVTAIAGTDTSDERVFGIPTAAVAQVRAGDVDGARQTADKDEGRVFASTVLALALLESGYPTQAREAASRVLETATSSESENDRDEIMVYAAWAQAVTGDPAAARRHAKGLEQQENRDGLLALIAEAQLEAGDFAGALATTDSIAGDAEDSDNEAWVFSRLVRGIAVDPIAAFDSLVLESGMPLRAIARSRIAMAQARAGDSGGARHSFQAAMQSAEMARSARDRIRGVSNIALARARVGDLAGAVESLDYAEKLSPAHSPDDGDGGIGAGVGYALAMRSAIGGGESPGDLLRTLGGTDQESAELFVAAALASTQLGRTRRAAAFLEAAVDSLPRHDDLSLVAAAYGSLADARLRQGDLVMGRVAANRALEIAEGIPAEDEDRVIGLFFAAVALARAGDIDRALDVAGRMQKPAGP